MKNKQLETMTEEERKEIKMVFAPGCFDHFDGTQEELDELIKGIQEMIVSGEIFEKAETLDLDELLDSDDPDDHEFAEKIIKSFDETPNKRNLQ